jgi:histidine kinase/DNA gyrase B/HSP90-like ATPase
MTEKAVLRAVSVSRPLRDTNPLDWQPNSSEIVIGKDILELLSTSMYVDPMTIYREYVQNAADAIDEAREREILAPAERASVEIHIDPSARSIRIRDNGTGVPWSQFAQRLSNLGASAKRGTPARGFRGVGRLAGLGYCQELIFRSRAAGEPLVSELRWDCRALKSALRGVQAEQHLVELIREILSVRRTMPDKHPKRFFEVELNGVIRHRNDRLLSATAVRDYLSQVAPVPFSPEFRLGEEITEALRPYVKLGDLDIRINGAGEPVYRPYRDVIELGDRNVDRVLQLEVKELADIDGGTAAIAWVLHHGYHGALPSKTLIKGIRLRTGNVQVGDNSLLEEMFPEPRFNGWAVGEVHVIDAKVLPNGRRDHFEQSTHFDNLLNQLTPIVRDIAKQCRDSSIGRKWVREFEVQKAGTLEKAKAVSRGGISRAARQTYIDAVAKSLKAMRKIAATRHISEEMRATLSAEADTVEARAKKLLGGEANARDPLERFKPAKRVAYQKIISLIYECASTGAAASVLVERILARLTEDDQSTRGNGAKKRRTGKTG